MTLPVKYAIIAAMEREVASIIRDWKKIEASVRGDVVCAAYSSEHKAVVLCAGIGAERAQAGTKVLIETFRPEMVTSIGFAGSIVQDWPPGEVFVPRKVITADGREAFCTAFGVGTLASVASVASESAKRKLAEDFGALAVDMEAAAVARVAQGHGLPFIAIKAISDGPSDKVDFLAPFTRPEGFDVGRFAAHVAVRPWLWPAVRALAVNSGRASKALAAALYQLLSDPDEFAGRYAVSTAEIQRKSGNS